MSDTPDLPLEVVGAIPDLIRAVCDPAPGRMASAEIGEWTVNAWIHSSGAIAVEMYGPIVAARR